MEFLYFSWGQYLGNAWKILFQALRMIAILQVVLIYNKVSD